MFLSLALEALDLARAADSRGGMPSGGAERGRVVVLRLLMLSLAASRGRLQEVSGALEQLMAPVRGADSRWSRLLEISQLVHARRGGALFAASSLEGTAPLSDACLASMLERIAACAEAAPELLGSVHEAARGGHERRLRSTHYTPPQLAMDIAARTLEPLAAVRAPAQLRVCDPAMGSGAFVLAVCRWLGARLGPSGKLRAALECVCGVDEDPGAVELARLSLWLECEAEALRFDCFDHSLRCGDALVGLEAEHFAAAHWDPARVQAGAAQARAVAQARAHGEAVREVFARLAGDTGPAAAAQRGRSMAQFVAATAELRELGEQVLGAFFASTKTRERERARAEGLDAAERRHPRPLHWWLDLPQLGAQGFDAVVGNPPFLGKNGLLAQRGRAYLDWLKHLHPGSHGNADYSAHFFRRAATLIGDAGTIGFVATNTIAQGDTRTTGLAHLAARGWAPYAVETHLEWPGSAKVTVSVVHLARGRAHAGLPRRLSGRVVTAIDSRLRAGPERGEPARLPDNRRLAYIGTYLLGQGFVLDAQARAELIAARSSNAARILPYLGGEALNSSPVHASARWAIDFGERSLAEAQAWPELLTRVRERVKPQRDRLADNPDGRRRRRLWWQHGRVTPSLVAALEPLSRCLVTSLVNKHLCFAFVPAAQLFAHKLCVFPTQRDAMFAVLQSRIHRLWAWRHSSTMRNAGINYSPSDCFETFPLPRLSPELDAAGRQLHEARAAYMQRAELGLTKTYNALRDPSCADAQIDSLRELHRALDLALLAAYGWALEVPPFLASSEAFDDALLDRLYALNAERASALLDR